MKCPDLDLRVATPDDADAVRQLHIALCTEERDQGFADAPVDVICTDDGAKYLHARLSGEGLAVVATVCGRIVGYLLAGLREFEGRSSAGLESMYVQPDSRCQGIGTALMRSYMAWFCDCKVPLASIAVAPANRAAKSLYHKVGFADHAIIQDGRTLILVKTAR
jgi:ribosomal protein S18 acetylase RimI-like enzyme